MTLQQLKYVTTIANIGSISEAAKRLFVSQPSLTKAIKELEKEMGITIFDRTNKGITVSKEGERFLGYARQVLEQAALLEEQYKSQSGGKKQFSVSTQHYSFAVNAFVELLKGAGIDQYDVSLRETPPVRRRPLPAEAHCERDDVRRAVHQRERNSRPEPRGDERLGQGQDAQELDGHDVVPADGQGDEPAQCHEPSAHYGAYPVEPVHEQREPARDPCEGRHVSFLPSRGRHGAPLLS